jgi:hypothetical protein
MRAATTRVPAASVRREAASEAALLASLSDAKTRRAKVTGTPRHFRPQPTSTPRGRIFSARKNERLPHQKYAEGSSPEGR